MEKFTEKQIKEYQKWTNDNVIPTEELSGRCYICGEVLSEKKLPEGPESKVVCLKDREYFVESYNEAFNTNQ